MFPRISLLTFWFLMLASCAPIDEPTTHMQVMSLQNAQNASANHEIQQVVLHEPDNEMMANTQVNVSTPVPASAPQEARCLKMHWSSRLCDAVFLIPASGPLNSQGMYRSQPSERFGVPSPAATEQGSAGGGLRSVRFSMYDLTHAWRSMCDIPGTREYHSSCEVWMMYIWGNANTYTRFVLQLNGDARQRDGVPHIQASFYPNYFVSQQPNWATRSFAVFWTASSDLAQEMVRELPQYRGATLANTNFVEPNPAGRTLGNYYPSWAAE